MFPPRLTRRKLGVLCPGFVGVRGQWSYGYIMQDYEYTRSPPSRPLAKQTLTHNRNIGVDVIDTDMRTAGHLNKS